MNKIMIISLLLVPGLLSAQTTEPATSVIPPPPPVPSETGFVEQREFQPQEFQQREFQPREFQSRDVVEPARPRFEGNFEDRREFQQFDDRGGDPKENSEEGGDRQDLERSKQMLKGLSRGLSSVKKTIKRLKKKNVAIPAEYEALVAELEGAQATIQSATEMTEEVEAALEILEEKGEELAEIGPKLGMLEQFPRIVSQAEKQIKVVKKQVDKLKKKAGKGAADTSVLVTEVEGKLASLSAAIADAKARAASGDVEDAMDALRENVFEAMDDLRDDLRILENISNISSVTREATREVTRLESAVARLKRQGKDVQALSAFIVEMKAKLEQVKALVASGDREAVFEALSSAEQLHNDALEELARLEGKKTEIDRQFEAPKTSTPEGASLGGAFSAVFSFFRMAN